MKFDIHSYDHYIVSFSGGKDGIACFLFLLVAGIPLHKIELAHQEIDARAGTFFDWEITSDYCRQFAKAFGVPIYYQWKEGGFLREMLRKDARTAPVCFELPDGTIQKVGGTRNIFGTRLRFPQVSGNLSVRWCSAYLKIMVFNTFLRNDKRFRGKRTLVLTGERAEESPQRAKYQIFEPHAADLREGKEFTRHIDHLRPVIYFTEEQIWKLIKHYRVRVHPCYYMGWGRCSCKFCIFALKDQFASAAQISPKLIKKVINYEKQFKCTIKRDTDLPSLIKSGTPFPNITDELTRLATGHTYTPSIIIPDNETWHLPPGAFKDKGCGAI